MITTLGCIDFLNTEAVCLDVRSPGEYAEGHIVSSENLPLLDNDNRKAIGICYKQFGKDAAITLGYELINPLKPLIIEALRDITPNKKVKIYCARGGLRSNKMAEFLNANGYEVVLLTGGYKAYRNLVLNKISKFKDIMILAGNTGTGKTEILEEIRKNGEQVLNLEKLANHKGSAFGAIGEYPQPSNTQFCNLVFENIKNYNPENRLWVESESVTIGKVRLPDELWKNMTISNGIEIVIPIEKRVEYIVNTYGLYPKDQLQKAMQKLSKRFGENEIEELCLKIGNNQLHEVVIRLLKYYDKGYMRSREKTNCQNFVKFNMENIDALVNSRLLLQHLQIVK